MKRLILILLLAILVNSVSAQSATNTQAGREEFEKGHNLFVLEEFKQAEEWFKKAVDKGHILSMTYLGSIYQNALNKPGFTRDYNEALKWYKMAAEKGEYMAMRSLSGMYAYGYGVPVDAGESKRWLDKASAAKAAEDQQRAQSAAVPKAQAAQNNVATSARAKQLLDQGVAAHKAQNFAEALKLFRASAEMGQTSAMFNLGLMYSRAEGVAVNKSEALKWYKQSAEGGLSQAMANVGAMYYQGDGVARDFNQAINWFRKAADAGLVAAMFNLGVMYEKGEGTPKNDQMAKAWYKKAADLGDEKAMIFYSKLNTPIPTEYDMGILAFDGGEYQKALNLFRKAADAGNVEAMYNAGIVLQNHIKPANQTEAFRYFKLAADKGHEKAQQNTGTMLGWGVGVQKNIPEARKYLSKLQAKGNLQAGLILARLDENGTNPFDTASSAEQVPQEYADVKLTAKAPVSKLAPIVNTAVPLLGKNGKYGLADRSGKVLIAPRFDFSPRIMNDGLIYISENKKYGVLDGQGRTLIEARYDMFSDFSEGLARVRINDYSSGSLVYREAFIDKAGKVIIQGSPEMALNGDFSDGRAVIIGRAGIGFIDRTGKVVIAPKYKTNMFSNYGNIFTQGTARVVRQDGSVTLINTSGLELTSKPYQDISGNTSFIQLNTWEGVFVYKLNNQYGFLDKSGRELTPPVYSYAAPFSDGLGRFGRGDKYGFIDRTGKVVIPANYVAARDFKNGLAPVKVDNKWGYIDKTGKLTIPARFEDVADFSEDVAAVKLNNRYLYIDKQGRFVIDPGSVEYAGPFSEGLAPIRKNSLYGFIDKTGTIKIQAKYFNIGFNKFENGIMNVELSQGKWLSIDRNGKEFKE